jgi:N-acetylmuramoyl-L-alanine amidase
LFLSLISLSKRAIFYGFILLLIAFPSFSNASGNTELKGIRYWSSPEYTRVVIDLTGTVEYSQNHLVNPDRLYFDLKNTTISKDIVTSVPIGDDILQTVRAGQFTCDTVRVVLDLKNLRDFQAFILEDPARLVIDVYGKEKAKGPDDVTVKKRIVIDPGHGGHDPGAVGLHGLYEKDVVLDIALKLRDVLLKNPFYEVFLTRETDVYVPLEERTAIANKKNADLFISIHANASPQRKAKGIETYLLNWTDNDEANRVAARENKISLKKMQEMNRQIDEVGGILGDLERQMKRDESVNLANQIQNSMIETLDNREDLGVKWAMFFVLFGARMPSVLVEVSFISNPEEEKLLSRASYRLQLAQAIADGLNRYFTSTPTLQKVAGTYNE